MISTQQIQRGGSKLEITRAIIEQGADKKIPVPKSIWRYSGQDLGPLKKEFDNMEKPVIVRGSHPNDYHGFIDVCPTYRGVNTFSELEEHIQCAEMVMGLNEMKIHCEDWEQPYNPEIHFLIQEQKSQFIGTMMRHPHTGKLMIEYFNIMTMGYEVIPIETVWVDADGIYPKESIIDKKAGKISEPSRLKLMQIGSIENPNDKEIREAIKMYENLESSGIIDGTFAQKVEFGFRPLNFFQANPFMKFEPMADFALPKPDKRIPHMWAPLSFGITPKKGSEFQFKIASAVDILDNKIELITNKNPYGLLITRQFRDTPPTGKRFGNIAVFCSPCSEDMYLNHSHYRIMKKADYSLIGASPINYEKSPHEMGYLEEFRESKIFSNGNSGIIIPVQFL